jgi:hypothetical protein
MRSCVHDKRDMPAEVSSPYSVCSEPGCSSAAMENSAKAFAGMVNGQRRVLRAEGRAASVAYVASVNGEWILCDCRPGHAVDVRGAIAVKVEVLRF